MLIMDRDCKRGGERFAIPTQGEVQGKLTVLEVVAITCLREVLASKNAFAVAALKKKGPAGHEGAVRAVRSFVGRRDVRPRVRMRVLRRGKQGGRQAGCNEGGCEVR